MTPVVVLVLVEDDARVAVCAHPQVSAERADTVLPAAGSRRRSPSVGSCSTSRSGSTCRERLCMTYRCPSGETGSWNSLPPRRTHWGGRQGDRECCGRRRSLPGRRDPSGCADRRSGGRWCRGRAHAARVTEFTPRWPSSESVLIGPHHRSAQPGGASPKTWPAQPSRWQGRRTRGPASEGHDRSRTPPAHLVPALGPGGETDPDRAHGRLACRVRLHPR